MKSMFDFPTKVHMAITGFSSLILLKFLLSKRRVTVPAGRRVIVTGAANGIGKIVTELLASKGWRVFACDVNEQGLLQANFPPNVSIKAFDIRNLKSCEEFIESIGNNGGSLDALVNIAGVAQSGPIAGFSDEEMKFVFEVNAYGPIRLMRLAIPLLLRTDRGGSIVNVTSVGGKLAYPYSGVYSPTKAAVELYCDSLRRESLANNLPLRVSVVAPGAVDTGMADVFPEKMKSWCEANKTSPFQPACEREANFLLGLKKRGYNLNIVAIDPHFVARTIEDILRNPNPGAYYVVATWKFYILYFLGCYLPTSLGDRLLISV